MAIADEVTLAALTADPHPHLARLRAATPVAFVPALDGWLVTGRDAAISVLRDAATFTVDDARFSTGRVVGRSMLSTDGAEHARHRRPFVGPFTPRRVEAGFSTFVGRTVDRRLDVLAGSVPRTAELRAELAGPVAAAVVAHALGLDGDDDTTVDRLLAWYGDIVASVSGVAAGRSPSVAGAAAMTALATSLAAIIDDPSSDSLLAAAVVDGGLATPEVVANAAVIMFGGIETTEGMILNTLWHVLGDPDVAAELVERPDLVAAAVEESLRLEPAAAVVDRYATRDVEVAGASITAGDLVVVSLAGANRDPAEFADPDRFELHRPNLDRQLAFATGPHVCIGMDLARMEARRAVGGVLGGFPGITIGDDAPPPTGLVFRKPSRLPVRWS